MEKILLKICSKKSDKGNSYSVLVADLGYKVVNVTFDTAVIAELFDLKLKTVNTIQDGEYLTVGSLIVEEIKE